MQNQSEQILKVQQTAINRALRLLTAAGCRFAVITPDGQKHGTLEIAAEVKPRTRARASHSLPYGALTEHTEKHISNVKAGECAVVPQISGVPMESLRSAVTSWASREWGNQSYLSSVNADCVEILRIS